MLRVFEKDIFLKFPKPVDFLEELGIDPVEVDPSLMLSRYVKKSKNGEFEIDVSFSAAMESFQVVMRKDTHELAMVSSEGGRSIKLVSEGLEVRLDVIFDIFGAMGEAKVILEPDVSFQWWLIRN